MIEGVYVVPADSGLTAAADVDREGVRIGVNEGSAYDLFLSRTLRRASLVRGDEEADPFRDLGADVTAGIRQPMTKYVRDHPGFRLIDGRFMEIRQALGTTRARRPETAAFLRAFVEELKASGFIADALRRAGQPDVTVAPPVQGAAGNPHLRH